MMKLLATVRKTLYRRFTAGTAETYLRSIEDYLGAIADPGNATNADVVAYLGSLRERYEPATIQKALAAITAFHDVLHEQGIRTDNPARAIRLRGRTRKDVQLQDLLTAEELGILVSWGEETADPLECRHRVLTGLLVHQALTAAELVNVRTGDVDLQQGTVRVRPSATLDGRELPLKPAQILLVNQYLNESRPALVEGRESGPEGHLLVTGSSRPLNQNDVGKHLRKRFRRTVEGHPPGSYRTVNPLLIRQSVITELLRQGHDLRVVQVFAGHKYPSSTERYRQSHLDVLRAGIQEFHPLR